MTPLLPLFGSESRSLCKIARTFHSGYIQFPAQSYVAHKVTKNQASSVGRMRLEPHSDTGKRLSLTHFASRVLDLLKVLEVALRAHLVLELQQRLLRLHVDDRLEAQPS